MAKQNLGGVYANMEFAPYTYQEYPKHVPIGPNGKYEVALNAAEEERILSKMQKYDDDAPAETVAYVPDPDKEILISRAAELGIPINRKWSKAKIQTLVEGAEDDVDSLPAESEKTEDEEALSNTTPEELKESLIAKAKSLGIPANKLWGIPRLKASIAEVTKKIPVDD